MKNFSDSLMRSSSKLASNINGSIFNLIEQVLSKNISMNFNLLVNLECNPLFRSNNYYYQAKLESLANRYNTQLNIVGEAKKGIAL